MTYYSDYTYICGICEKTETGISDGNLKGRNVFNRKLKKVLICQECQDNIKEFLCQIKGCRVLKEPNSNYCCRHDENSIVEVVKIKVEQPKI